MLPEVGATELLVIAAIALIVVGPKDLPVMLRKLGQFIARLRGMAAEFRASFEDMAHQSELDELRREVEAMRAGRFLNVAEDAETSRVFEEIDADLRGVIQPKAEALPEPEPAPKPKTPRKKAAAPKPKTPAKTAAANKAPAKKAPAKKPAAKKPRTKPKAPA